jgi:hypothetical protein
MAVIIAFSRQNSRKGLAGEKQYRAKTKSRFQIYIQGGT